MLLKPGRELGFIHSFFSNRQHGLFNLFIGRDNLISIDDEKTSHGNKGRSLIAVYKYVVIRDGLGKHCRLRKYVLMEIFPAESRLGSRHY